MFVFGQVTTHTPSKAMQTDVVCWGTGLSTRWRSENQAAGAGCVLAVTSALTLLHRHRPATGNIHQAQMKETTDASNLV